MSKTLQNPEPPAARSVAAWPALSGPSGELHPVPKTREPSRAKRDLTAGQLGVRSERRGKEHIVALSGELDLSTVQRVEAELQSAEATDAVQITLDLSGLDFLDSTGLQLILAADGRSRSNGQRLRLLRGPQRVQRIFEITATTERLPFAD